MCGIRYAWAMAVLALCGIVATPGRAGVSITGDTYDTGAYFYAGKNANTTAGLTIDAGSVFSRESGYIGYVTGSTGTAIVTGVGSNWTNARILMVGCLGTGTLRVEAGAQVNDTNGFLGDASGSTGTAIITGAGSKWANSGELNVGSYYGSGKLTVSDGGLVSTKALYASLSDLYGNGTITVQSGGVLDADLVFDASHGLTQTLGFGSGGTLQFTVDGAGGLGVGYKHAGSLRIADGRSVSSPWGNLGYNSGSMGTAVITGAGSKWTSSGELYVGSCGSGSLRVEAGGQVSNTSGYLGYSLGTTGTAVITGAGSKWTNSGDLRVGSNGSGSLLVEAGGQVISDRGYLGPSLSSVYTATITGAGSKWITSGPLYVGIGGNSTLTVSDGGLLSAKTLYASVSDLRGNGTITARSGAILDADLVFDATHGLTQTLAFGSGGTLEFSIDGTGDLGVGYKRSGSLRIAEGRSVTSTNGYVGYSSSSTGTAVVTGAGSKWTNSGFLEVGFALGGGRGSLAVSDGGQVSATSLGMSIQSTLRLHVSGDRMLVLGNASTIGSVGNAGTLSLMADAFLAAGTYRPIGEYAGRSLSWSGIGSTLAVGGMWSSSANTFTVVAPTLANAGTATAVASGRRLLISDPAGERAGVSLGWLSAGARLTGMPLTESERAGLLAMLGSEEMILSGWEFEGQLAGGEALVSLEVGVGAEDVRLWRRSQGGWSEYTPEMVTYDAKGIVSFTVDPAALNGSGYAVSGVVPEPMGLGVLMVAVGMGLVRRRRMAAAAK